MPLSKEHIELQNRCLVWLGTRITGSGIRGSTEVSLAEKYIADAVALCRFQSRYTEYYCLDSLLDEVCVFEVKISKTDFLSTFGKRGNRYNPIGTLHWCVTPKNLVKPSEVPLFWGLLEKSGRGLREVKRPEPQNISRIDLNQIAYNLLWIPYRWTFAKALSEKDKEIERLQRILDVKRNKKENIFL